MATRPDRRGNLTSAAPDAYGADGRLEEPRHQDHEEDEAEGAPDIAVRRDRGGAASHALEDHGGHHQRHDASRRVVEPGRADEAHAGEDDDAGAHLPGPESVRVLTY